MQPESQRPSAVVNAWIDGDQVVALHRTPDGGVKERSTRAEWVSYHRAADLDAEKLRRLRNHPVVRSIAEEGEWLRIAWRDRNVRERACKSTNADGMENPFFGASPIFEGDVHPIRRWMTDAVISVARPTRAYFDLETDSRVPFQKAREGGARILSWAIADDAGNAWSDVLADDTDAAERKLIDAFFARARSYEQLLAWNGDGFDFPVLAGRVDRLRVRADMRRWLWLDHLACYKRNHRDSDSGDDKTSLKLQDVAMAIVGEGKDEFDASKTWEEWEAGGERRERLRTYNVKDTALLPLIEKKTGYIELSWTLAEAAGVFPDSRGLHPITQVDAFMFRFGRERGVRFPTKEFREVTEQFAGAFVLKPTRKGIVRGVHVIDFRRQYPSAIITWNMSPETKLRTLRANHSDPTKACEAPTTKVAFRTDIEGMLPLALKKLIELRNQWDKKKAGLPPGTPEWEDAARRAAAYKAAINSFYGVMGSPFSRYFDREIAESVTQTCAWLIKATQHEAEKRGWSVIYIDTDSIFVVGCTTEEFRAFSKWCNEELYPRLVREQGCVENDVWVEYEKAFDRVVFCAAKKYVGRYEHYKGKAAREDSKPEIKGLEYKRGDSARLARALQERLVRLLVGDWAAPYVAASVDPADYERAIIEARQHVLEGELTEREVVISKSLTKDLGDYKVKMKRDKTPAAQPRHVTVAKEMQKRGSEIGAGSKIGFVVLDAASNPAVVIPAEDYEGECDRHYLWENLVWPPTERLMIAAFPEADWKRFAKTRPAKPRGGARKGAGAQDGPAPQVGLFGAPTGLQAPPAAAEPPPAPPTIEKRLSIASAPSAPGQIRRAEPMVFEIPEASGSPHALRALRGLFELHAGEVPVRLRIRLATGAEVELATPFKVRRYEGLALDVATILEAARHRPASEVTSDGTDAATDEIRGFYERCDW